jgi:hypothetical protein
MMVRVILKMVMLGAMVFSFNTGVVNAALITGEMGLTGNYSTSGGIDLSDDTDISLNSVTGTSGTGDLGATVSFGTVGVINNGNFSLSSFSPVTNVYTIGGWQLDLTTLGITDQTASLLTMEGTGILSGNGYENTLASWTFSSQSASSYSMSITAVPVPAAVWLFGSGLIGLVGLARKKA